MTPGRIRFSLDLMAKRCIRSPTILPNTLCNVLKQKIIRYIKVTDVFNENSASINSGVPQ